MLFHTRKAFLHRNTHYMFDQIQALSDFHCKITTTFKAQKTSKDFVKIVHVTSVVQPKFDKAYECILVPS